MQQSNTITPVLNDSPFNQSFIFIFSFLFAAKVALLFWYIANDIQLHSFSCRILSLSSRFCHFQLSFVRSHATYPIRFPVLIVLAINTTLMPYFCSCFVYVSFLLTFSLFATFKREKEGRRSKAVQGKGDGSIIVHSHLPNWVQLSF